MSYSADIVTHPFEKLGPDLYVLNPSFYSCALSLKRTSAFETSGDRVFSSSVKITKLQNLQEYNGSNLLMHWEQAWLAIYSIPVNVLFSLVSLTSVPVRLQTALVVLLC